MPATPTRVCNSTLSRTADQGQQSSLRLRTRSGALGRTRVLNNDLADNFRCWYPGFTHIPDAALNDQPAAA
jgi:hypothetical protein